MNGRFTVSLSTAVRRQIEVETLIADIEGDRRRFLLALANVSKRLMDSPLDFGTVSEAVPSLGSEIRSADVPPVTVDFVPVEDDHIVFLLSVLYKGGQ